MIRLETRVRVVLRGGLKRRVMVRVTEPVKKASASIASGADVIIGKGRR